MTKEKYNELTNELNFLRTTKRTENARQLEYAKTLGDLAENAEYHEARELQALTEDRIRKIEYILKNAEIVSHKKGEAIEIGSSVVVQKEREKDKREFLIVGSEEADSGRGWISHNSPMGSALMGKKKGEEFVFRVPNGAKIKYKILKVS